MKKRMVITSAAAAALILSVCCVNASAAESDAFSYLTGRQRSVMRNEVYAQAAQLPEEERDAFLAENGIGEIPYSEEAAASYSYIAGRQRGAAYRQSDDTERAQDTSGYSYITGQQRGSGYHQ